MGAFADFGWAWNVKPARDVVGSRRAAIPSAEFTESFVIFLYGCTNVFLEHLAAWGGAWTAQDLEHVSISVMFFGGGLVSSFSRFLICCTFTNTSPVGHDHRIGENPGAIEHFHHVRSAAVRVYQGCLASAENLPLFLQPHACSDHYAPWQNDEFPPSIIDALLHDP